MCVCVVQRSCGVQRDDPGMPGCGSKFPNFGHEISWNSQLLCGYCDHIWKVSGRSILQWSFYESGFTKKITKQKVIDRERAMSVQLQVISVPKGQISRGEEQSKDLGGKLLT